MDSPIFLHMELKDWALVISTVLGPILAVQAQKAVERFRERYARKARLFEQLMATREARVAPEHVRGLNMIDMVFYGNRTLGVLRRSAGEQRILDAWKEYLDHLNNRGTDVSIEHWATQGNELFTNLLYSMAQDLGYKFDRVQLKRGVYSPLAHAQWEEEQTEMRKAVLALAQGKQALQMNVVGFPVDPDVVESNKVVMGNLGKALEKGVLHVEIDKKN